MLPAESTALLKFAIEKGKKGLEFKTWEFRSRVLLQISDRFSGLSIAECLGGRQRLETDELALDELLCLVSAVERRDAALGAEVCRHRSKLRSSLDCKSVLSKGYVGKKSAETEVLLHPFCKIICAKN